MTESLLLSRAIAATIRGAGFNVGCQVMRVPGHERAHVVNAVDSKTLESFTVTATSEQAAWIELAQQCGIEWED